MAKNKRRQKGEGALFQRSDGRWVARVELGYGTNGGRREFYGATPEEAMGARKDFLRKRADGFTALKGRAPRVGPWMMHWLHYTARGSVEETTWHKTYKSKVERHIVPFFERTPLTNEVLDEALIGEFHQHLLAKGLSPSSVGQVHRILSQGLKAAVVAKKIARNPASNRTPPKVEAVEMETLLEEEVEAVLEVVARRRSRARWLMGMVTGMRQGEVLGLMWSYVDIGDPERATVAVEWEITRLPWAHGCDDPHACGKRRQVDQRNDDGTPKKLRGTYHRFPCPPDCKPRGRHKHVLACAGNPCTVHVHEESCKTSCRKIAHLCPCPSDCTGHASACPKRKAGGQVLKRPKSAKSRRTFRIPPELARELKAHKAKQAAERLALGPAWEGWAHTSHSKTCPKGCTRHCSAKPRRASRGRICAECNRPWKVDSLVFTQPSGRPVDAQRDWSEWQEICAEADVDPSRVHDLRHLAATRLLQDRTDIKVVQHILGHANPAFTQKVYQHVTDALLDDAADAMSRGLGSWPEAHS